MRSPGVPQKRRFICCFGLHIIFSFLIGSISSVGQDLVSKINAAQSKELENAELPSESIHPSEIVKPAVIRNRRSNFFSDKEHLYGNNADLNSAFLYSDQIMQNLLNSPTSKPLSYTHSNFFLNYLKPRTTRYNAWDDHSLMHFGKRSLEGDSTADKVLVKRSADFVTPNNAFDESPQNTFDTEIDDSDSDSDVKSKDSDVSNINIEKEYSGKYNTKKSTDPWHSMMSFGKKSQSPWDHNTMHFGKRDEPWHNIMSFGKRDEPWHNIMSFGKRDEPWHNIMSFGKRDEPWHNIMSFGKRDEPWHNIMSFGKKSDPWHNMMSFGKKSDNFWDHNTLHFGKKDEPWHNMMSFGKRLESLWDHNTLHFGKRDEWDHNTLHFGKRDPWDHNTLHFGKRDPWDHNTLHFGKRDDPWHNMMSFGKKFDNSWDHNTLHFGKREDPWHNMMSFGKKSENSDMTDLEKREDPWHNMMSFGKKSDGLWNNSITMVDKRNEPWHSMMSFGKKSGNPWDHNTLHFGKKDEPWHSMMSFGKKSDPLANEMNSLLEKGDYPSNNMMNFGKRGDGSMDDLSEDFSRNSDPWYDYDGMIFYKRSSPWDHNTLHFGKKSNATWETSSPTEEINLNRIKKRSVDMWNDHHTMHFGKKFDPWESHNTMHFGKKSDLSENNNLNNIENKEEFYDFNKADKNIEKKFDWDSHNTMHFGKRDPEDDRNTFHFDKRDPWDYHNTMHFGKRDPWDYHNTMHFGKRDPWDYHNTMHFGKRDPWDYHNTMHFGKKSNLDLKDRNSSSKDKSTDEKENESSDAEKEKDTFDNKSDNKELSIRKRSSIDAEIKERSNNKKIINETPDEETDHQNFWFQKQPLEGVKSTSEISKSIKNDEDKTDYRFITSKRGIKDSKSKILQNLSVQDHSEKNDIPQVGDKISHIQKRSVKPNSFINSEDSNSNINLADKYSKEDIADAVLHFGKRSVEVPVESEYRWFDGQNDKRFDDFWNNHNTMHFGKKSDPWDNHNTLHFGKKSNPQKVYSDMSSSKRDPWEYLNTLHFGKRFDPWDGHAKMHFGKRTDNWDHNVMHFGKRKELISKEFQDSSSFEDFDQDQMKDSQQSVELGQDDSAEDNDFLVNLSILKSIINSNLKGVDSLPFEERVNLLRHYLKPILRAIIDDDGSNFIPFSELNDDSNKRIKLFNEGNNEEVLEEAQIMPYKAMNEIGYDEDMFRNGNDDSSYGEYGENSKNLVKTKRKYLGKAELKRYFVPFQGPKSIVYPHAWFASQIRRSSLPRTNDYARNMEMRMAEKKEDPFNSYMHFGRR